jgi:hypothetical protein
MHCLADDPFEMNNLPQDPDHAAHYEKVPGQWH